MPAENNVKSLIRAISVLECFSIEHPELGVTEIAGMLGMQKSTVYNILTTFNEQGYLIKNPQTQKYSLGYRLLHYGYIINSQMNMRDQMMPFITQIANETHEVCYFAMLDNLEVLYVEAAYPPGQMRSRNILGERAPLYCTGLGKAMMAYLPENELEQVLARPMVAYTGYTHTDPAIIRQDLEEIRTNGYAVDNMEHEFGIRCVSVPLFGNDNRVIAAVSVSGPSPRFDPQTVINDAHRIIEILRPVQHCF